MEIRIVETFMRTVKLLSAVILSLGLFYGVAYDTHIAVAQADWSPHWVQAPLSAPAVVTPGPVSVSSTAARMKTGSS